MITAKLKEAAEGVEALVDAAWALSLASAGAYEDRHKFTWDVPEIEALKKLRKALKKIGAGGVETHERNDSMGMVTYPRPVSSDSRNS